jgi:hypothetical protein
MTPNDSTPGWYLIREGYEGELLDGGHNNIDGVVQAARLHEGIFNDAGPWQALHLLDDGNYTVCELPDAAVNIDYESVAVCAEMVASLNAR